MNPWYAKAVVIAASIAFIAIRAPHGARSRRVKTAKSHKGALEIALLSLAWLGFFIPIIWIASPLFRFAEFPLHLAPLLAGIILYTISLWLFHRSHIDLGVNWSVTLELREQHQLITNGVYRTIRHPMYTALFLYGIAQALVIPNWFAASSYLITFGILYALRINAEEKMMLAQFPDDYALYMQRTRRLIPGIW